jgi:hypothetical protein
LYREKSGNPAFSRKEEPETVFFFLHFPKVEESCISFFSFFSFEPWDREPILKTTFSVIIFSEPSHCVFQGGNFPSRAFAKVAKT